MIRVEVRGATEVSRSLKDFAEDKMIKAAAKGMKKIVIAVERYIKEKKLSGQVLKVRSGHLRRNVAGMVASEGGRNIIGIVGVRDIVPYGAIHEFGGKSGKNLKTTIPPRPYMGPSLGENEHKMYELLDAEVQVAVKEANQ